MKRSSNIKITLWNWRVVIQPLRRSITRSCKFPIHWHKIHLTSILRLAYNSLLHRISPPEASERPVPKKREDYPKIRFWLKHEWTKSLAECGTDVDAPHGKKKGENVAMRFVETADGNMINGHRAESIRRHARSIWVYIAKGGTPPATWGSADLKTKELYCREMCNVFEELSLCNLDWKAEQIATDNYSSWHTTWVKQIEKSQLANPSGSGSDSNANVKRNRCESTKPSSKRKKVEGVPESSELEIGKGDTVGNFVETIGRPLDNSQVRFW
jgi:hypothetical protein